jgi:L-2-hydroxyglutarate oxidase LhgO
MTGPECDVLVIGAGVVGLASAAALARAGRSVVVVERHDGFGRETTSRNSQVLHAGLYYPAGTWKARLCVAGSRALYARCQREGIPHRRIGKLVVATATAEIANACALGAEQGAGSPRCSTPTRCGAWAMVRAIAALHSPATGIVDAHALCLSFAAEAGAALRSRSGAKWLRSSPRG